MESKITDSIRLKASNSRFLRFFFAALVFFLILVFVPSPTDRIYQVVRILGIPATLFGMMVLLTGACTTKYDSVLSSDGITVGKLFGTRQFRWADVKAVLVTKDTGGTRVHLEITDQQSTPPGRVRLIPLPDNYGMKPKELATLILRWQREFGGSHSNS
jgi:hypothetical protein